MFSNLWFHQFDYDVPQCGVVCIYPTWSIYPAKLIGLKVKVFITLGKVLVIISSNRLFLPQYEPLLSPRLQHEWWTVSYCPTGHEELHFSSVLFFSVLWCLCLQSVQKCWGAGGCPETPTLAASRRHLITVSGAGWRQGGAQMAWMGRRAWLRVRGLRCD